jgi:hypothetical protein
MNRVMKDQQGNWYIITIQKTGSGKFPFVVEGFHLWQNGSLRSKGGTRIFSTREEADRCVKRMVRNKKKVRGFLDSDVTALPNEGIRYLRSDVEKQMSNDEFLDFVRSIKRERYVFFEDVTGMEEKFDTGLEYLGILNEDSDYIDVYDRFGNPCTCHLERFSKIVKTERSDSV